MSEITDLLTPWIRCRLGDDVPDPQERLAAYRQLVPGNLPQDYTEGLLFIRGLASLESNEVLSVEKPTPRIPGIFGYVSPHPPIGVFFGLQRSHSNVFEALAYTGDIIPPTVVAIGQEDFGDLICLDVSREGNGRIHYWWNQGERRAPDDPRGPGWGNMFLLAHSFTDLLRRMRPAPELDDNAPVGRVCYSRL